MGGVDIVCELIENGEFDEMIPAVCKKKSNEEEVMDFFNQNKVVVLIYGTIDQPENE